MDLLDMSVNDRVVTMHFKIVEGKKKAKTIVYPRWILTETGKSELKWIIPRQDQDTWSQTEINALSMTNFKKEGDRW